ncbi:unnamed protein product [Caenorhabditis brenneri]
MKYFLTLLLIGFAFCQDDDYGCADECPCGHMNDTVVFSGNYEYSEQDGCLRTIMCREGGSTTFLSPWSVSEITKPADARGSTFFLSTSGAPNVPNGAFIDLFAFFGVICENNAWYATKYPKGISYQKTTSGTAYVGSDGSFDGKKTKLSTMVCSN